MKGTTRDPARVELPHLSELRVTPAAVLWELGQPLAVEEVELPGELRVGQVLVRVLVSGVCGSQVGEAQGVKGPDRFLPHLLGHEGCGEVCETGPGVRRVERGDRVVMHWRKAMGIDAEPGRYRWRGRALNAGWVTTFSRYTVVSENRLTKVGAQVPADEAALLGCPVTTGLGVVTREARVTLGESVVVFGAGGVGLSVIQGAALAGATPIVAVDLRPAKLELARRLGATHVVEVGTDAQRTRAAVLDAVGAGGADVVVDNTGVRQVIELAYTTTSALGRTVLVGVPHADEPASFDTLPLHFGRTLTGSHGGGTVPELDIPRYLRLRDSGRLNLREMITDRYTLERVNDAMEALRLGEVTGRCVIDFEAPVSEPARAVVVG